MQQNNCMKWCKNGYFWITDIYSCFYTLEHTICEKSWICEYFPAKLVTILNTVEVVNLFIQQLKCQSLFFLWVLWGLTKDSLSLCVWKYFFTVSRYLLKISTAKYIVVTFFLVKLWPLNYLKSIFVKTRKNLRFLRPNKRNP